MVCWPWWLMIVLVFAAAAGGFVLCFVWHWWLISRPGAMDRRPE